MRNSLLVLLLLALVTVPARADDSDRLLQALQSELGRSVKGLQLKDHEKPYFIQYSVKDTRELNIEAQDGALVSARSHHSRPFGIEVRVGNYQHDSGGNPGRGEGLVLDDDVDALRHDLWLGSDGAYRQALQMLAFKKTMPKKQGKSADVADFSAAAPVERLAPTAQLQVEEQRWKDVARRLSAIVREYPSLIGLEVAVRAQVTTAYLLNSEGTRLRQPHPLALVVAEAETLGSEGETISQMVTFASSDLGGMASEADMAKAIRAMCAHLVATAKAPALTEEYLGPALFIGPAASSLFADVLVPVLCGDGAHDKMNKPVLPVMLTVRDDPTLTKLGTLPLLGGYSVDDEGVAAQPVALIERGVLTHVLSSRTPTRESKSSNGHGRDVGIGRAHALPSNLIVGTSGGKSYAELKQLLIERCKAEGLPFGMIVRVGSGDSITATRPNLPEEYYKVSVATGKEELVRTGRRETVNLRGLKRMVALGADVGTVNFLLAPTCAVSVAAPSLLLGELQVSPVAERRSGEGPVIPRPPAVKEITSPPTWAK